MVDPIQGSGQVNFPSTPNNSYENMLDATDKLKTQMQLYQEALTNYRGDPSDFKSQRIGLRLQWKMWINLFKIIINQPR